MARWRNIKNSPKITNSQMKDENIKIPSFWQRLKAFLIDFFMIYVPLIYFFGYVVFDGKDDFNSNELAPFLVVLVYGLITVIFWVKNGQTPGKKAFEMRVVDAKTHKLISFPKAVFRFIMFLFSATILIGVIMPLMRKDKKALHDLISATVVTYDK